MTNQKHGEVGWGDESLSAGGGNNKGGKDQWLKLKPGSNLIRVLTLPHQYYQHRYKVIENGPGFGHRFKCSAKNGFCPICAKENKPKKRWLLGVIDRGTNSYKILDVGWSVLNDIQTYARDDDWGDPIQYDFDIVVNPHAGPIGYYKAVAKPKKPLSGNDLVIKDKDVNLEELVKQCTPPDPKKIEERIASIRADMTKGGDHSNDQAHVAKAVSSQDFGDDEDFPNSDAKSFVAPF